MSLKRNILANYASQFYVTIIGILMVPLYIKYMGSEAYGLVGFFSMLQAWFAMLDMGLTPTISREAARFNGGATDALSYRRLIRALEGIFLLVAIIGGAALYAAAGYITSDWLKANQIPLQEVQQSLEYMAIAISLRWMCGLYRGAVSGAERMIWLGCFNALFATVRFVFVLPLLMYVSHAPTIFFAFQLGVSILEITALMIYSYRIFPAVPQGHKLPWEWAPLKPVLKFSLTIAFTSSVWVLVTQTDKLVLSKILSLSDYGHFTLAVLVASGILVISGPISSAIMPRMAKLEAEANHAGLIKIYRESTQLVALLAGAASLTIAFCAEPLLSVWTSDRLLAQQTAPILQLYALGNGILTVAAFPYYLQYAKGDLRLHFIGNAVFVVVLLPAIIFAAISYSGVGAGYVWLGMNALSFLFWLPFVHKKFEPQLNYIWYREDIFYIWAPMCLMGAIFNNILVRCIDGKQDYLIVPVLAGVILFSGYLFAGKLKIKFSVIYRGA